MGLKYLSIAALQKGEEYTHALCIGTFHAVHYLFTKIGEFTLYVKDGLYYQIKKYIPGESDVNESDVDISFDSTIKNLIPQPTPTPPPEGVAETYWFSSFQTFLNKLIESAPEYWNGIVKIGKFVWKDIICNSNAMIFILGMIGTVGISTYLIIYDCLHPYHPPARSIELLENDEVATIGDLTFSKNTDEYKFIDNYVNSQIKAYEKIHSGSGERFSHESGYPYYYVKNKDIITEPLVLDGVEYNKLKINLDDEIKQKIITNEYKEIFKVILRKNVVFDSEGRYIKEFIIYTQNNEIYNPLITFSNNYCDIDSSRDSNFYIAFDKNLDFNPYSLYIKGELSIMYLLSQDALVATKPTIKCEIIEAKNALKLHESDVKYFYKPDIITETDEYYKMVFKI